MISPRLKIVSLIAIAVACFLIREPILLIGLFAAHVGAWFAYRLPPHLLVRLVKKLSFFIAMILLAFALFPAENIQVDVGRGWALPGTSIAISPAGLLLGGLMALRMLIVIIASQIVQMTGKPGEFVAGLRGLMIPEVAALTIDSTLYLLGPQGGKRGSGEGKGGGRGMGRGGAAPDGVADAGMAPEPGLFSAFSVKRLKNGDFGFFVEMIEQGLARSRAYVGSQQSGHSSRMDPRTLHDVSIISGICLLMLTTKLLKVLPGIPFAPGYKITFLVPLYILAAELTHTRFGATITGTTVGVISFLFGDGRFGIFEIFKHITPGLVVDLLAPFTRRWMARPSTLMFMLLGALCALTRATTMLAVVFFVEGNAVLYALVGFQGISQVFFGALSGFVTFYLVKSLDRLKVAAQMVPAASAGGGNGGGHRGGAVAPESSILGGTEGPRYNVGGGPEVKEQKQQKLG